MSAFKGRVVLITGGSGELGRVMVERFVEEGARVVATHKSNPLKRAELGVVTGIQFSIAADVTDEAHVRRLFDRVQSDHGSVDILVNCVGDYVGGHSVADTSLDDWKKMMTTNLQSCFLCCREFLRSKRTASYGRIINIAAKSALHPAANRAAYSVSKAGIVTLTACLGEEIKDSGITVNALAPYIICTQANMNSMPGAEYHRWVDPKAIADLTVWLCSDNAKSVNGTTIPMGESN